MNREIIPFTTREAWLAERARDITSTDVAALFGVSPYLTRFELWHRRHGSPEAAAPELDDVERVVWGRRLQNAIAEGAALDRDFGWIREKKEYIRLPDHRIGASFDWEGPEYIDPIAGELPRPFLLECKNVDSLAFREGWEETEFGLEAPAHIELQCQHQMLVSGIRKCYIAALVGGNRLVILERDYDEQVGQRILEECAAFWSSPCPEPDFRKDAELIKRLYRLNGSGDTMDADERIARLMDEAAQFTRMQAVAKDECEARLAELRTLIGNAGAVLSEKHKLSRWTVKETPISYTRAAYDVMRITERKQK